MSKETVDLPLSPEQEKELIAVLSGKNAGRIFIPAGNNLPARPMTMEEMEQYIKTLENRIVELERRMNLIPWSFQSTEPDFITYQSDKGKENESEQ